MLLCQARLYLLLSGFFLKLGKPLYSFSLYKILTGYYKAPGRRYADRRIHLEIFLFHYRVFFYTISGTVMPYDDLNQTVECSLHSFSLYQMMMVIILVRKQFTFLEKHTQWSWSSNAHGAFSSSLNKQKILSIMEVDIQYKF